MAGGTSFGVALALFASSRTFPLSLALVALAGALQAGALAEHFGAPWAVAVGGLILNAVALPATTVTAGSVTLK